MAIDRVPMTLTHFAVHAEDVGRARRFYERVFGWRFEPWGPPDFYLIQAGPEDALGVQGSLQRRTHPLPGGEGIRGFECTIAVDDIDRIATAVAAEGGQVIGGAVEIPGVGSMIQFLDTEGNPAAAMRYETVG